ncbi:hypothetical protein SMACR_07613 [Sordaria macrospora]|uniref:WGS project CABT00000000 data, contig 2.31 n=2 Tax=Sordaria macrospora TaxID=5147 RepID=F7W5I0_SORMK|nr:uncharacterized protein SMAC_07613 [Sordaria macrospora k-hell]KAA8633985.1 hypothetical protein SMACR_07613 [Sordaria macrospora]KAH7629609.1 hypothetical protein B0T09DRAFT_159505 [Sordaria sp. MPI-SDFR-AT-0083]WPJ66184.1 hypothetical protein SMAC4_07613 [Sordaria macrospora]CCC12768.1 unnamed protein product [Sordaria macrospora k-hell]
MGQNLSLSEPFADTSGVVLSPADRTADIILGITWACSAYGIGVIFAAVKLLERWAGEHGERGANLVSVVGAFLCGSAWPLVLVYLWFTEKEVQRRGVGVGVYGLGQGQVVKV